LIRNEAKSVNDAFRLHGRFKQLDTLELDTVIHRVDLRTMAVPFLLLVTELEEAGGGNRSPRKQLVWRANVEDDTVSGCNLMSMLALLVDTPELVSHPLLENFHRSSRFAIGFLLGDDEYPVAHELPPIEDSYLSDWQRDSLNPRLFGKHPRKSRIDSIC
jgi:hypothetical protein